MAIATKLWIEGSVPVAVLELGYDGRDELY